MKVAPPNIGSQKAAVFLTPKQARACHACLFTMFTIVKEFQAIQSLQALKVALAKPRIAPNSCLSPPSCQSTTCLINLCADMLARTREIPSFSAFFWYELQFRKGNFIFLKNTERNFTPKKPAFLRFLPTFSPVPSYQTFLCNVFDVKESDQLSEYNSLLITASTNIVIPSNDQYENKIK